MKAISSQIKGVEDNAKLIVKSFFSEYDKTPIRLKVRWCLHRAIACDDQVACHPACAMDLRSCHDLTGGVLQIIDAFIVYALLTCATQVSDREQCR